MEQRRIVITGIGLVTPCGKGWMPYWGAVLNGQSQIRYLTHLNLNGFPVKLAGQIPNFEPSEFVRQKKMIKLMSREIQLAVAASRLAIEDSGLDLNKIDPFRIGISLGAGVINNDLDEVGIGIRNGFDAGGQFRITKFAQDGVRSLYPLWFLKYLPNMPACHISIMHSLQGPSNTITTSSAAGAQAIGEAFHVIKRGDADMMLAGGTDSKVNAMGISRFHLLGLLSRRNSVAPEKVYCPFDSQRDGLVLGEGSGLLVLEERKHALKRGARIYGEIAGYGSSSDFNYDPRSAQDYTGKCLSMERALRDAGTAHQEIDFVMANGSGIPQDDVQEASAIQSVFGKSLGALKVTAVKPITGHLVYGSGGIEIAAAALALYYGIIPPVVNLETPDPACELPFVRGRAREDEPSTVLVNSFGFGGQNATVVIRK